MAYQIIGEEVRRDRNTTLHGKNCNKDGAVAAAIQVIPEKRGGGR